MFKSKKADFAITLLVVMVLILCVLSAFIFLTKQNSYERDMQQIKAIPATYANEEAFVLYIQSLAKEVITDNPTLDKEGFISAFQEKYKEENIPEYNSETFLKQINDSSKYEIAIDNHLLSTKLEDKKLSFKLKDFEFSRQIFYSPGIKSYIFYILKISETPKQEAIRVKHVQDIVFQIAF